jgi:hypothetical protein
VAKQGVERSRTAQGRAMYDETRRAKLRRPLDKSEGAAGLGNGLLGQENVFGEK